MLLVKLSEGRNYVESQRCCQHHCIILSNHLTVKQMQSQRRIVGNFQSLPLCYNNMRSLRRARVNRQPVSTTSTTSVHQPVALRGDLHRKHSTITVIQSVNTMSTRQQYGNQDHIDNINQNSNVQLTVVKAFSLSALCQLRIYGATLFSITNKEGLAVQFPNTPLFKTYWKVHR